MPYPQRRPEGRLRGVLDRSHGQALRIDHVVLLANSLAKVARHGAFGQPKLFSVIQDERVAPSSNRLRP